MKVKMILTSILSVNEVYEQISSYNLELEESDELIENSHFADALLTNTQKLKEAIESLENETKEKRSKPVESHSAPFQKNLGNHKYNL